MGKNKYYGIEKLMKLKSMLFVQLDMLLRSGNLSNKVIENLILFVLYCTVNFSLQSLKLFISFQQSI